MDTNRVEAGRHGGNGDARTRRMHGDGYRSALWMEAKEVREDDAAALREPRQEDGAGKDDGHDVSGKGGTASMHTPEPAIAARCVGGCGAPDFAG